MSNASETVPIGTTTALGNPGSIDFAANVEIVARERYTLGDEIAQGGIGRILRASDKRLERQVALKQLLDPSPENEARFLREALVTAKLQHPAIVPVYDVGRFPDGEIFYAMKVTGRSLAEVVEEAGSFDKRLALLPHVIAVAEAIAYAHSEHIVHRDLKPANVLIGPFGETVVIDWGIAKDLQEQEIANEAPAIQEPSGGERDASTSLTMAGAVLGTPGYMPPEQAAGNAVDERADVYALGAILYHVLAGVAPYEGKSGVEILARVLTEAPPDLSTRERRVPGDLLAIVKKAMERDPRDRYPTANEFAHDLRRFQTGQIVGAYHYSRRERVHRFVQKHRAVLATTALGLLLVGVIACTSLVRVLDARRIAETERDRANDERARAETKQSEAETASRKALQQSDELLLLEARNAARRDPNAAIAWLSSLSESFHRWSEARLIAADAREYGIAKILRGHTAAVNMIAYSPDGSVIATASDDKRVGLWTSDGRLVRMLEGHTDEVWKIIFTQGNQRLLSSSKDGTARLWDVESGETLKIIQGRGNAARSTTLVDGESRIAMLNDVDKRVEVHDMQTGNVDTLPGEAECPGKVEVSSDHRHIAYSVKGKPRVFDVQTREFRDYSSDKGRCLMVHASRDGRYLGCAGEQGYASLWDAITGRQLEYVPASNIPNYGVAHFSPDGNDFLYGRDTSLYVKNLYTGTVRSFQQHEGPMFYAAFSHDGRKILTTSFDRTAILLDPISETRRHYYGFRDTTSWADFSPNDDAVAVASWDSTARIFPLSSSRNRVIAKGSSPMRIARISADGRSIVSLEQNGHIHIDAFGDTGTALNNEKLEGEHHVLSSDASIVAYATKKGTLRIHKVGNYAPDVELEGHTGPVERIALSLQNNRLLSVGTDKTVRLWDLATRQHRILIAKAPPLKAFAFSMDGANVAMTEEGGLVRVFPTAGGPERTFQGHAGEVYALRFLPDGKRLASGGQDHTLRIWVLETGQSRVMDASGLGIIQILASRDGKTLYTLGSESVIRRWDVETGNALPMLRGHRTMVVHMDLSPEGKRLVSTGSNGDIRVWDLATGQSRMLEGHRDSVPWVLFAPEGDKFISTGNDGTTRIWYDDLPFDGPAIRAWMAKASPESGDVSPIVN
jgi:eukaryotic-like serine/threonine-protein kinase